MADKTLELEQEAPAITNAAAVETLKVLAQLDPVPAVSIKRC